MSKSSSLKLKRPQKGSWHVGEKCNQYPGSQYTCLTEGLTRAVLSLKLVFVSYYQRKNLIVSNPLGKNLPSLLRQHKVVLRALLLPVNLWSATLSEPALAKSVCCPVGFWSVSCPKQTGALWGPSRRRVMDMIKAVHIPQSRCLCFSREA